MADVPTSYKDPYWSTLASATEDKLALPKGLLVSIMSRGERSNADQVSEAGARTPFQIIPPTRQAAIKQYGVDPYLSPENAAEVAGMLLKDSLKRNKGDAAAAVGEYHGGTDRSNWGPRTKSYIARVMTGVNTPSIAATLAGTGQGGTQSTFDRVQAQQKAQAPQIPQIAAIFNAYQSGQMTPEEAAEFEQDVKAGAVMLPRGATLKGQTATEPAKVATTANTVPDAVVNAWRSGQMSAQESAEFEADLKSGVISLPTSQQIPLPEGAKATPSQAQADPSLVDKIIGGGEAALTVATGLTGGTVGMIGGTIGGLASSVMDGTFGTPQGVKNVEQSAAHGAEALTYQPRTVSGQQQAQVVGEAMQNLIPLAPLAGEAALLSRTAAPAAQATRDVSAAGLARIKAAVPAIAERVERTLRRNADLAPPTPGTRASGGSAATDIADQRTQAAASLEVPVKLTAGQATRDPNQLRFELETSKGAEGAKFRERYSEQNELMQKNFNAMVDKTGAEAADLIGTGRAVDQALRNKMARDQAKVRVEYKNAEKAGEMEAPVALDGMVQHLNESAPDAATAPLLTVARGRAIQLGIAAEDASGQLTALPTTLKNAERMRQAIGRATDYEATNMRQSAIIKGLIDSETEGMGGNLYRTARRTRENFAKQYEDRAVVASLINKKRGMADRQVALEDVFNHTILNGTREDVGHVRRVLQTGGEEGQQAWRELQGATVSWIKSEAFANTATDMRGNVILSVPKLEGAIKRLEKGGKLDFVFGKRGAEQLRDLNDLAKVVYTAPPGVVNTSNTASVLLAALTEAGVTGSMTGLPVPVLSALRMLSIQVKNRRIQKRIEHALNYKSNRTQPAVPPQGRTIH